MQESNLAKPLYMCIHEPEESACWKHRHPWQSLHKLFSKWRIYSNFQLHTLLGFTLCNLSGFTIAIASWQKRYVWNCLKILPVCNRLTASHMEQCEIEQVHCHEMFWAAFRLSILACTAASHTCALRLSALNSWSMIYSWDSAQGHYMPKSGWRHTYVYWEPLGIYRLNMNQCFSPNTLAQLSRCGW